MFMVTGSVVLAPVALCKTMRLIAVVVAGMAVSGCSGSLSSALESSNDPGTAEAAFIKEMSGPQSDLDKATAHWSKEFEKDPRNAQNGINYARNLKALGQKEQALAVLQAAHGFTQNNRTLNSEYGRLALEMDQTSTAQKLLEQADDPTAPDWRTISARGTVLAKQGKYRDAIPHFERALALAPNQASILNNLALAKAMDGDAENAEHMLRKATDLGNRDARINQNLALVLGLQGKYDESKAIGGKSLPADSADSNVAYVRNMVQIESKPIGGAPTAMASIAPVAAATGKVAAKTNGKAPALKGGLVNQNAAAALADAYYAAEQANLAKGNQPIPLVPTQR
jgi:Flp pilus assembly protein TadD